MKANKPIKTPQLNLSIHRRVLQVTGDVLSALIFELIHYRFTKNDKKPVWLKIDWIHERLPYISRSGLAKKLKKLVRDGHIKEKKGVGKHYHKCWYSPSPDVLTAHMVGGSDTSKVYYNLDLAEENLEASVVYAAIINLLKIQDDLPMLSKGTKKKVGAFYGRVDDQLQLDYGKLAEGSGLSLYQVRRAVKWLIDNKKIEAKKTFGNKRLVRLPTDVVKPVEREAELPTESFSHWAPPEDPTEY